MVEKKKIEWKDAAEKVKRYIFKITTPRNLGTGFLCAYANNKKICGIATAAHVVKDSYLWEEPIRLKYHISGEEKILRNPDRIIFMDHKLDSAIILFMKGNLRLPDETLNILPEKRHLKVGVEVGWLGYPAISPYICNNLCFFSGNNSCWIEKDKAYLVDGVAINGVSGGPAFFVTRDSIKIIGSVTAYLPNVTGLTPGLAMISSLEHYHSVIKTIKDFEEAKEKEILSTEIKEKVLK